MRWWLCLGLVACAPRATLVTAAVKKPSPPSEVVRYCVSTFPLHDVPTCRREVTAEQQRHRPSTERLLIKDGKVVRLDVISASGAPVHGSYSLIYEHEGERISGWSVENPNGVLLGRSVVNSDGTWLRFLDEQDRPEAEYESHASGQRRELDAEGRVQAHAWVDYQGAPALVGSVHRTTSEVDSPRAQRKECFWGLRGEPTNKSGAHCIVYGFDERGFENEQRYLDESDRPAFVRGAHVVRETLDAYGNIVLVATSDAEGKAVRGADIGAAAQRIVRDDRGNPVTIELLDEQGRPTNGAHAYAKTAQRFDELDRIIEVSFFDVNGAPVRDAVTGAASQRFVRDARGNVVSTWLFDERGAPTLGVEGYQRIDSSYDARDELVLSGYFDANGARTTLKDGYSAVRRSYDGNRLIRVEYLGTADRPTSIAKGYASYEIRYAADGSAGKPLTYDLNGAPQLECNGNITTALQKELSERAASTRRCYERLLRYGEAGEGRLMVELKLDVNGNVLASELTQDDIGDTALSSCVLEALREPYENKPSGGECAAVRIPLAFVQKR